jgi:hypothetical protein
MFRKCSALRIFRAAGSGQAFRLFLAGTWVVWALGTGLARADVVTDWNAIMEATVTNGSNAVLQSRMGAIVQLAVFEAVNAIEKDYEPYLGVVVAPDWASPEAAAIAAAHRTLVTLRPTSAGDLDAARALWLGAIADGPAKEAGITAGEDAAAAMLAARANDGSATAQSVPYTPGTEPGDWQPISPATPLLPGWGQVTPFGLLVGSQFRLPPPPALHTRIYANDYDEVKLLGRVDSPVRPLDRTNVAKFYAITSPVATWNPAARQASLAQGRSLSENARNFALLGMVLGDGAIAAFDTKFHYGLWRPQGAIRGGDVDGNPLTAADPDWTPLITTPSFPSYASAHATLSGAARRVLEKTLGKDGHDVTLTNTGLAGVVLEYTAWEEITDDIDDARIYGGIHFRFDQEAGARQGRHIGSYALENYLRPVDEFGELIEDE